MNYKVELILESLKSFKSQSIEQFRNHVEIKNIQYNINEAFSEEVSTDCELYYNYLMDHIEIGSYNYEIQNEICCYIYYACFVIAHKYHCDYAVTNTGFVNVIRKDLDLLNHYEIQVLKMLNYELNRTKYQTNHVIIDIPMEPEYDLMYDLQQLTEDEPDTGCFATALSVLKYIYV